MTKALTKKEKSQLLATLQARFEANPHRHEGVEWSKVQAKLEKSPDKLRTLARMEETGGEPDVVILGGEGGTLLFVDCAAESPSGRRSLCFDEAALQARKENKPAGSAMGLAEEMGATILSEKQYRELQKLGEFDLKTSSWVQTPAKIRKLGGALFCDRRFDTVFVYHNGATSYYAARGFRAALEV